MLYHNNSFRHFVRSIDNKIPLPVHIPSTQPIKLCFVWVFFLLLLVFFSRRYLDYSLRIPMLIHDWITEFSKRDTTTVSR